MLYAFDSEIMENVFEWHPLCPCHMKKDMVASGDVYRFLEEYIGELGDEERWKKLNPSCLECVYCLMNNAMTLARMDKYSYEEEKVAKLTAALIIVSKRYKLYKKIQRKQQWKQLWQSIMKETIVAGRYLLRLLNKKSTEN